VLLRRLVSSTVRADVDWCISFFPGGTAPSTDVLAFGFSVWHIASATGTDVIWF
ncbi:uncharacterized protein METZ01_LOCUS279068, partial [marine metagenome]